MGGAMIERQYGFIPLNILVLHHLGVEEIIQFEPTVQWLNTMTNKVRAHQLTNCKGDRIPIASDIKVHNWRTMTMIIKYWLNTFSLGFH